MTNVMPCWRQRCASSSNCGRVSATPKCGTGTGSPSTVGAEGTICFHSFAARAAARLREGVLQRQLGRCDRPGRAAAGKLQTHRMSARCCHTAPPHPRCGWRPPSSHRPCAPRFDVHRSQSRPSARRTGPRCTPACCGAGARRQSGMVQSVGGSFGSAGRAFTPRTPRKTAAPPPRPARGRRGGMAPPLSERWRQAAGGRRRAGAVPLADPRSLRPGARCEQAAGGWRQAGERQQRVGFWGQSCGVAGRLAASPVARWQCQGIRNRRRSSSGALYRPHLFPAGDPSHVHLLPHIRLPTPPSDRPPAFSTRPKPRCAPLALGQLCMVAAARRRLAQAVATLARQASTSSGAARGGSCLVFDSRATTTSLAQGGLARNKVRCGPLRCSHDRRLDARTLLLPPPPPPSRRRCHHDGLRACLLPGPLQFPWSKVSLGFAAAGLMTVAQPPSAGCTATATADPKVRRSAYQPPPAVGAAPPPPLLRMPGWPGGHHTASA